MTEMESNTQQMDITTPDRISGVESSMKIKLESLPSVSTNNCCIYKVPEFILKGNEEYYRPIVMSIGPIYYKEKHLEAMQEVKWIYLKCFLEDPDNKYPSLEHYINFVREKEDEILGCYQEQKSLSSDEFIEMIVLDAAFLIYLFKCGVSGELSLNFPFLENMLQGDLLTPAVYRDILLVENQLPFLILKEIYDIAFGNEVDQVPDSFIHLTLRFICHSFLGENSINSIINGNNITNASNVIHLVDLLTMSYHVSCVGQNNNPTPPSVSHVHKVLTWVNQLLCCSRSHLNRETELYSYDLSYTAKQLKDAGVKFVQSESDNPLDITFTDGESKIPTLNLSDGTESIWRNILYFEQSNPLRGTHFTDYVLFLDALIDTVEDVQVLARYKIICNYLGSDADSLNLFNKVGRNWAVTELHYSGVCKAVNAYASTPWNRWMATLRTKYFYNPWVIISVIAAFMLFILTLLQTIASYVFK